MLRDIGRGPAAGRHHGRSRTRYPLVPGMAERLVAPLRAELPGNGVGSRSAGEMLAEAPDVMARFADGSLQLPCTAFPLSRAGKAWAHPAATAPSLCRIEPFIRT
ncbi:MULTISPECIES: hypothetical protein [unclassified Streptomyces]|uniref:hypothetical protein n=1 Tax=unclassified Streptomyces TaxID=2593676 RepID=UPI0004C1D079|nr:MULTISPECIES: hypothetical protein [unclassified Streptomyces]